MKRVRMYFPNSCLTQVFEVGKDGVTNVSFTGDIVKIEYSDGLHVFHAGMPFVFESSRPERAKPIIGGIIRRAPYISDKEMDI